MNPKLHTTKNRIHVPIIAKEFPVFKYAIKNKIERTNNVITDKRNTCLFVSKTSPLLFVIDRVYQMMDNTSWKLMI